jgi:hypothetical protein
MASPAAKAGSGFDESSSRFGSFIEHELRASAFAFVARGNRYPLFRIMLQAEP